MKIEAYKNVFVASVDKNYLINHAVKWHSTLGFDADSENALHYADNPKVQRLK